MNPCLPKLSSTNFSSTILISQKIKKIQDILRKRNIKTPRHIKKGWLEWQEYTTWLGSVLQCE